MMPAWAPARKGETGRPSPEGAELQGDPIERREVIVALVAVAAGALLAGGLAVALGPRPGAIIGNHIGAGHPVLSLNHGQDADLRFDNLAPGERRGGDQLITADLRGVGTADLYLRLSGAPTPALADQMWLTVRYSDPEQSSDIGWDAGACSPTGGYPHSINYPSLSALGDARAALLGVLTPVADGLCARLEVGLAATAGNDLQCASANLAWTYLLQQISAGAG